MTEDGKKPPQRLPNAAALASETLAHLQKAMELCGWYRQEIAKLIASLEDAAQMYRNGKDGMTITRAIEAFVKEAKERLAKGEEKKKPS